MTHDPTTQPARRRWLVPVLVAAAVLGLGGIALAFALSDDTVTVKGRVQLYGSTNVGGGDRNCHGLGGYIDLKIGAEVVITDNAGATVGLTSLQDGRLISDGGTHCLFTFTVDVPAGKGFYGVEVTHRGRLQYPEDRLGGLDLEIGR